MLLNFTEVFEAINEADNILIVYNIRDPAAYSAASALWWLKKAGKNVKHYSVRMSGLHKGKEIKTEGFDLILFLGIHKLNGRYLYDERTIKIDDSFSFEAFSHRTKIYIANSKNFRRTQTLSHAHFAYEILKEFEIETPKGLDLLLMVGDRDDNREVGMTWFQRELMEKNEDRKLGEAPNFVDQLKEYKIFNFPTFLIFFDYLKYIDFEYDNISYTDDLEPLNKKVNVGDLISEFNLNNTALATKLEELFDDQSITSRIEEIFDFDISNYELIYAPMYSLSTLDDMLLALDHFLSKKINKDNRIAPTKLRFWDRSNIYGLVSGGVKRIKRSVIEDLANYERSKIYSRKIDDYTVFGVNNNLHFGGRWNWLPFFNWNSILVEYNYAEDKTNFMVYSKSNLHAGAISGLAAKAPTTRFNSKPGYGNGEFFKGALFRYGNVGPHILIYAVRDVVTYDKSHLNGLDPHLTYHSTIGGEAYALVLKDKDGNHEKIDLYVPYGRNIYDATIEEFEDFLKKYDVILISFD